MVIVWRCLGGSNFGVSTSRVSTSNLLASPIRWLGLSTMSAFSKMSFELIKIGWFIWLKLSCLSDISSFSSKEAFSDSGSRSMFPNDVRKTQGRHKQMQAVSSESSAATRPSRAVVRLAQTVWQDHFQSCPGQSQSRAYQTRSISERDYGPTLWGLEHRP